MPTLTQLHAIADTCPYNFPHHSIADPNNVGLIAFGGDLRAETLLHAYRNGLFPWFNDNEPIAWWSPAPRCVVSPNEFVPKKSLIRTAKKHNFTITLNHDFYQVIKACSLPRTYTQNLESHTWITDDIQTAYGQLHQLGISHSIEVWDNDVLIGGLYGEKIGAIFFGESMFHKKTDASKLAFWALTILCQQTGVKLIDCQVTNEHLLSLGAFEMARDDFLLTLTDLTTSHSKVANESDDWVNLKWQINCAELLMLKENK